MSSRRTFTASDDNLLLVADATSDFFSLEGGAATAAEILEIRVWQRGATTLVLDTLVFRRGAGSAITGGTALTEDEWDTSGTAAVLGARSLPTVAVATVDWEYRMGWNLLQEALWLPTPEMQIQLAALDDFGIYSEAATAHTGVGVCVTWAEWGV